MKRTMLRLGYASFLCAAITATSAWADAGSCLEFDGTNDYVNIGHDTSLDVGNTLTVEAWIKADNLSSRRGIFSTRLNNEGGSFQLEVGTGNGGTNRVAVTGVGTWVTQTGDNAIQTNQWTHVAYIRTGIGSNTHALYVNGVAQTLISDADYTFTNNGSDKVVGCGTLTNQFFAGRMDELRVWSVARSETEIRDAMHKPLDGLETGLVAYYQFNTNAGATLPDLTTNANTGALIGMTDASWVASDFPCAAVITNRNNLRGVWFGNTNSLASSRLSVSNAAVADPDFAIVGHDGGADAWQAGDVPSNIAGRITRAWRAEVSGSVTGQVAVDTTGLSNVGEGSSLRLLVSTGAAFSNATVVSGSFSGSTFTASSLSLANGSYYTLGSKPFATNTTVSLPKAQYGSVAWGDYDNDGYLDFLVSGNSNGTIITHIYHNNGDSTFTRDTTADAGLTPVDHGCVAWGDYNNDGHLDFVLSGYTGSTNLTRIYRNNGDGTFTRDSTADARLPGEMWAGAAWGDYDNDGNPDLVLSGNGTATVIYRNNGDGTFSEDTQADAGLPNGNGGTVAWGDFNNDGRLDLLVSGSPSGIYRNDPAPHGAPGRVFTDIGAGLENLTESRGAWGDYDNDGDLDCVLHGNGYSAACLYRNNGDGTFTQDTAAEAALPWSRYYGALEWGDYDNDGCPDLLRSWNRDLGFARNTIYRNSPAGTFTDIQAGFPGSWIGDAAWGDYDNDGKLDVVLVGQTGSSLYHSTVPVANTPPGAPSNLAANVTDGSVTLSWDAASDAKTPTNTLTYNLRIGTTPGGSDILSAMADATNGFRRVPAMGNVQYNRSWTLPALPQGQTYYWSVQAVDGALAGGPWATAGSFAVPVLPVVTTAMVTNMTDTTATSGGHVASEGDAPVTARGICWNTNGAPTLADNVTTNGSGAGSFTSTLTNLVRGETYYVRAYATSAYGTSYGPQRAFFAWRTADPPGNALAFNGSTQYVSIASSADLQLNGSHTLECWFKTTSVTNGIQGLISKYQSSDANGWYLRLNDTEVEFDGLATSGLGLTNNAWYHLAGVKDGTNYTLYVNGSAVGLTGTGNAQVNGDPVRIASDYNGRYFAGTLDEVRIWNTARSQQEVREAMHLTFDTPPSDDLVAYYHFDQSSGTNLPDHAQSPVLHEGTLVNMTDAVWAFSTIPAGRGKADTEAEAAGNVTFTNVSLTANFSVAGSASLTATRIDAGPARPGPAFNNDVLSPHWVVDRFGSGGFTAALTFAVSSGLTAADESNPSGVALFNRASTSAGVWTRAATAVSVDAAGQTVTFTNIAAFGQFTIGHTGIFAKATGTGLPAMSWTAVAWGDYDNDSHLDLLLAGDVSGSIYTSGGDPKTRIYRNNGDGTFTRDTTADAGLPGIKGGGVAWGDYDNDGRLDFALAGSDGNTSDATYYFSIYHNNGDGTFAQNTAAQLVTGYPPNNRVRVGAVSWGDYDNDGRLDLLVMGAKSGAGTGPRLYHNDGGGVFTEDTVADSNLVQELTNCYAGVAAWGDYNNDGRRDLLVTGDEGYTPGNEGLYPNTRIYRNNSDGTFTRDTVADAGLPQLWASSAAWGDYDNDGWLDFALTGRGKTSPYLLTRIYRNNGDGAFTRNTVADLHPLRYGSVAWGDANNDGRLDLLLTGGETYAGDSTAASYTKLYRNDGGDIFTDLNASLAGGKTGKAIWGDSDGNGTLDILVSGLDNSNTDGTHLYPNGNFATNTPPSAPAGLAVAVTSNTATLSWNAAADGETPASGLTYNLRIGSTPGGSDVFSGMADTNGWRRIPALGNTDMNRSWIFQMPDNGGMTFHWSVQAVDGAWAGGPWAAGGSFDSEIPVVFTDVPTNITGFAADCGGEVTAEGDAPVTAKGLVWQTNAVPTLASYLGITNYGGGTGSFNATLTNLVPGQTYYVRAYATNSFGVAYGTTRTFTTLHLPVVTTATPTNVTDIAADYGGEVTVEGATPVTARGVCWGTNSAPTLADNVTTNGTGAGIFSGTLTNLIPGSTYYYRAYATNSYGTSYGSQMSFTTLHLPVVTTDPLSNITETTADCGGNVTSEGAYPVTARGLCWSTNSGPTPAGSHTSNGTGLGHFADTLTGLTPGQTYYVRAYASNSYGTAYGTERVFATTMTAPGNALAFDGTNSYVNLGNDASFNVGNVVTVEAWIKPTSLAARYGIFSTRRNDDSGAFQLEVGTGGGRTNRVALTGQGAYVAVTGDNVIESNRWAHVAYVRTANGAGNQTLYVNGVAQSLTVDATYSFEDNSIEKVIGEGTSGTQRFPGQIDELRVWNVARTEDQIRDAMHRELTGNESGLVAYYKFNQSSGTSLADLTTNNNAGALSNGLVWTASTTPLANQSATNGNIRGAWLAQTNSLASSIVSVSNAVVTGTDFRVFGHNGAALTNDTPDKPAGYIWRLNRAWQTEGTGAVTGTLTFDCAGITNFIQNSALLRLMTDANGTFADAGSVAGSYDSGVFTVAGQTFPTNGWYTLGERIAVNWIIAASAGANGAIAPAGNVAVAPGGTTNFVITPDEYWHVDDVTTNGASIGPVTDFTWSNVTADGTIHAEFAPDLAALGTPHWWLAQSGLTNGGWSFDQAETNKSDSDAFDNGQEYICDTDPTNPASYFHIAVVSNLPPLRLYFDSSSNRIYTLNSISNLVSGVWTNVPDQGPRYGAGGPDWMQDTNSASVKFYRVNVNLP